MAFFRVSSGGTPEYVDVSIGISGTYGDIYLFHELTDNYSQLAWIAKSSHSTAQVTGAMMQYVDSTNTTRTVTLSFNTKVPIPSYINHPALGVSVGLRLNANLNSGGYGGGNATFRLYK